jgi:nitric oxide reductase activation protein
MLLAETMDELGEPFAMQGFCSNTRRDVRCYNIKSFTQVMDHEVLSRIAAIPAQYSTRMGAAIRHAVAQLQQQEQHRKLLLLVTDGMPSDIDVYDPVYLLKDARQAVLEARDNGVLVYTLCLDPQAGDTMTEIFGRGHFALLDNLARLPETLASIFLRLIRDY